MRAEIGALDGRTYDVVVVGGGINGACAAEQLATAGYSVLLAEKGDFASGASSRSSRLLHCGLRYLAPGRSVFDFVRHPGRLATGLRMARLAMAARSEFVGRFPARTDPIRMHFPLFRNGPYKGWQVDLAFRTLRLLGPRDPPLEYRRFPAGEAGNLPLVRYLGGLDRLDSVAAYREYLFDWPERVVVDAVLEAERSGATVRNHTKAQLVLGGGEGWTVELMDLLSQSAPIRVRGRTVLNMAGLWIDEVSRAANPLAGPTVVGTKGAHILVQLPGDCRGVGVATLNSRNEPFYCIPWKHLHFFGPTETAYDGDPDLVFTTEEEQEWLLAEANRLFPSFRLNAGDVVMTWAGVRPLTFDPAVPFGNRSRVVHDLASKGLEDVFAMTGGPIMTHLSAGREMAARVRQRIGPPVTGYPPDPCGGSEAGAEHAAHLSDLLFRRRDTGWSGPIPDADLAVAAADLGGMLRWDADREAAEIAGFKSEWERLFAPRTGRHSRSDSAPPERWAAS